MVFEVAGLVVQTKNECGLLRHLCADFLSNGTPALTVELESADPVEQSVELLRRVNDRLIEQDTFLMHCSALAVDGEGYLFAAPSGTGKSTHAAMWRRVFGDRVVMINDDKPFIRVSHDGAHVYSSPWRGKHNLGENICRPLKAICFVERGDTDEIAPITPAMALDVIFDQLPRYTNPAHTVRLLELVDKLLTGTPLYRLRCTPTEGAAERAFFGMNGDKA